MTLERMFVSSLAWTSKSLHTNSETASYAAYGAQILLQHASYLNPRLKFIAK
jgi:hypothetical protein